MKRLFVWNTVAALALLTGFPGSSIGMADPSASEEAHLAQQETSAELNKIGEPFVEGSTTVVVIPDTQYYVNYEGRAPLFTEITEWIVANKDTLNIELVLHVGDIVNDNTVEQWERAKNSLQLLDDEVPYVLSVGNHDLGKNGSDRSTMLNDYFSIADNPLNERIFGGSFEQGCLENVWYQMRIGDREYIIFALEFGPRAEVVQWANDIASMHPNHSMILVTHDFIDHESTLYSENGWGAHTTLETKNNPNWYNLSRGSHVHCGKALFDAFVSKHPGFDLVVNGHYKPLEKIGPNKEDVSLVRDLALAYRMDSYANGNVVHQMLFNAQWAPRGGDGWIRLLEFRPDGKTVQVKTFSPYLERKAADPAQAWRVDEDSQYTISLSRPAE